MRKPILPKLETARDTSAIFSAPHWGAYGAFLIQGPCGEKLKIVASAGDLPGDETGWEHVSVSVKRRLPNWIEMCFAKDLFWTEEECAVQFHPPRSSYVNNAPNCLHLFRPVYGSFPMPPPEMVGLKSVGENLTSDEAKKAIAKFWQERDLALKK